ncbi:MAG TPA: MJ0042-type zinc finger domain-containing protein [Thermomicrobiales bacterium]|nr:MJ0042-type zinc finger domain-containing protein [Thermomicrobiales bacterium]
MDQHGRGPVTGVEILSPTVREIIRHLCESPCHTYGAVLQWCEARGDCTYAVQCPSCTTQFLVDEAELEELERWTDAEGHALVCGVRSE